MSQEGRGALRRGLRSRAPSFSGFHGESCGAGFGWVRCLPGTRTKTQVSPPLRPLVCAGSSRTGQRQDVRLVFAHRPRLGLTPRASSMAGIFLIFVTAPTPVLLGPGPLWLDCFYFTLSHTHLRTSVFSSHPSHRTETSTPQPSF